MSGPTPFSQDGLPLFTEERPAVVILGDLLDYIQEMRRLYDDTQELYKVLQDNLSFIGSGSPKGVYASLSALQTAKPTGDTFIYVTTDNGNWYYWNGLAWVSGGVYQASQIPDGSITHSKLSELYLQAVYSKNLFNKNSVTVDKAIQVSTGLLVNYTGFSVSEFIKINPSNSYWVRHASWWALYDSNKVFISGGSTNLINTPSNAVYFRISTSNTNLGTQQLELGTAFTNYVDYRIQMKDNEIDRAEFIKDNTIPETKLTDDVKTKLNKIISASTPSIQNFNQLSSLSKFRASVAKLNCGLEQKFNICVVGDSISEGMGVSDNYADYITQGYVGKMRNELATLFGETGKGFIPSFYGNQITYNGTWSDFTLIGVAGISKYTTSSASSVSLTFNGVGLDILTYTGTSQFRGSIGVKVDGGTENIVSLIESTANMKIVNVIDNLSDGNHTIEIRNIDEGKEFHLIGVRERKGNKGFIVNMCSKSGITSTGLTKNDNVMKSEIDVWNPVLTIIATITNDIGNNIAVDVYKTNILTLINRAKQYGDVVLLANNVREDKTKIIQDPYVDALKELAINHNCAIVNAYERWNFKGQSNGLMADILHPNKYGHQELANAFSHLLLNNKS